jgi:DNA-binding protein H-NS
MKEITRNNQFRTLILMRKSLTQKKISLIKKYVKKREQYNAAKKEDDEAIFEDIEKLRLHLSVVDLVSVCAKNNPFCVV